MNRQSLFLFLLISVFASLSEQKRQSHIDNVAFIKLGSYSKCRRIQHYFQSADFNFKLIQGYENNEKTYFIPRYFTASWIHSRSICKAYEMDFVSLDTLAEAQNFLKICRENAGYFGRWTHIGGITLEGASTESWYWVDSGNHINYTLNFGSGQPDNYGGNELCLSIGKYAGNQFYFNDIRCEVTAVFVCQKHSASLVF